MFLSSVAMIVFGAYMLYKFHLKSKRKPSVFLKKILSWNTILKLVLAFTQHLAGNVQPCLISGYLLLFPELFSPLQKDVPVWCPQDFFELSSCSQILRSAQFADFAPDSSLSPLVWISQCCFPSLVLLLAKLARKGSLNYHYFILDDVFMEGNMVGPSADILSFGCFQVHILRLHRHPVCL